MEEVLREDLAAWGILGRNLDVEGVLREDLAA